MQRLFSVGHPNKECIPALKKLWSEVFGDSPQIIDNFFNKTAEAKNIFCVFCDNEPVSVMYGIDAGVFINGKAYKSLYIYAVCTREDFRGLGLMGENFSFLEKTAKQRGVSYLFLVPASKTLFELYEKSGFSTAFTYGVKVIKRTESLGFDGKVENLTYLDYTKLRLREAEAPQALLNEKGFECFYSPVGEEMQCISLGENGFAIFESEAETVTVFELFGDQDMLLSAIFNITQAEEISVHIPDECGGEQYGMVKILDDSPTFENGFFGVSYGG